MAATRSIPQYEADGRHAIDRMDRLVHNIADECPDFVRQYRQTRITVDSGIRHDDDKKSGDKPAA